METNLRKIDFDRVYCLFEQSGVFKRVFKDKGFKCYDVDIANDFGHTDILLDLFFDIDLYRLGSESFFRHIGGSPLFLAFFPCTYFSQYNLLFYRGNQCFEDGWDSINHVESRLKEMARYFVWLRSLIQICEENSYKLIIENPYHESLLRFFMRKPDLVDYCRHWHGDSFKKPTAYWFYGCQPAATSWFYQNKRASIEVTVSSIPHYHSNNSAMVRRSLIHPEYAKHFVECFILGEKSHVQTALDFDGFDGNLNFDE